MTTQNDIPPEFTTPDAQRAYRADRAAITITAQICHAARMIAAATLAPTVGAPSREITAGVWQFSAEIRNYCDVAQEEQTRNPDFSEAAADHAERTLEALRSLADGVLTRLQSHVDALTNNVAGANESANADPADHIFALMNATAKAHREAGSVALSARHTTARAQLRAYQHGKDTRATIDEARRLHEAAATAYQKTAALHRRTAAALNFLDASPQTQEGSTDDNRTE